MEPLLSIHGLSVSYGRFRALHDISLQVGRGELVAIIGANGAGKSSLLKSIVGQAERVSGTSCFAGRDIAALPTSAIVAAGIALVPEGRRLFPSLTVEENLAIGWDLGRRRGPRIAEIYEMFPVLLAR